MIQKKRDREREKKRKHERNKQKEERKSKRKKQDRFTTCFKTCGTGSLFGGWVEGPSKQTDRTDGEWVQSTFWLEKITHFDMNVKNARSKHALNFFD